MTCPVCGTVAVPGARFCHNCGAALPAAATLPAAERRVVTVLFGDLSEFTSWSEDLDPERVGAVTDRVLAALAGAVKTFGGHVDKLTGDGIMAVFGAPVAHEDDAERAVRAALSMQRAVRRVLDDERGGGAPLGLRVGLNTGDVIAGIQAAIEYTVIGDTVNTAARLADAAAVGAVYAGARTAAATRHVASWRALRPLRLKGKREPVEAYELLGLLDAPGTRSGLGDEAPYVGRETEIGRVAGRLAEVIDQGDPRVLLMTAEAGIGKSRFAAEVERLAAGYDVGAGRYAAHTGARVLSVRCAAFGERRRLAPLADLVRAAVGLPSDAATALTRPAVEERLRRLGQRLARSGGATPPIATDQLLALLGYAELPAHGGTDNGEWGSRRASTADAEAVPNAVADLLSGLAVGGAAGDRGRRPARRHRRDDPRPRADPVPAHRPGAGAAARPSRAGPHRRRADPRRGRRGALPAAAAWRRRRPAADQLPRRREAAAGRRGPAARHRPGQPVLPGRAGHAADRARRAHHGFGARCPRRRRARPADRRAGPEPAGQLAARAGLTGQPAALPGPRGRARRPDRRAAAGRPFGAAGRRGGRRHRADRRAGGAARAARRPGRTAVGGGRAGTRQGRRGAAATPDAAPHPYRLRVRHPADARGRVRRGEQGRAGRAARRAGPLGGAGGRSRGRHAGRVHRRDTGRLRRRRTSSGPPGSPTR